MMTSPTSVYGSFSRHALVGIEDARARRPEGLRDLDKCLPFLDLVLDGGAHQQPAAGWQEARMMGRAFPPVSVQARAWTRSVGSGDADEATAGDGLSSGPVPGSTGAAKCQDHEEDDDRDHPDADDGHDRGATRGTAVRSTIARRAHRQRDGSYGWPETRGLQLCCRDAFTLERRRSGRLGVLVHLAADVPLGQAEALLEGQWERAGRIRAVQRWPGRAPQIGRCRPPTSGRDRCGRASLHHSTHRAGPPVRS